MFGARVQVRLAVADAHERHAVALRCALFIFSLILAVLVVTVGAAGGLGRRRRRRRRRGNGDGVDGSAEERGGAGVPDVLAAGDDGVVCSAHGVEERGAARARALGRACRDAQVRDERVGRAARRGDRARAPVAAVREREHAAPARDLDAVAIAHGVALAPAAVLDERVRAACARGDDARDVRLRHRGRGRQAAAVLGARERVHGRERRARRAEVGPRGERVEQRRVARAQADEHRGRAQLGRRRAVAVGGVRGPEAELDLGGLELRARAHEVARETRGLCVEARRRRREHRALPRERRALCREHAQLRAQHRQLAHRCAVIPVIVVVAAPSAAHHSLTRSFLHSQNKTKQNSKQARNLKGFLGKMSKREKKKEHINKKHINKHETHHNAIRQEQRRQE